MSEWSEYDGDDDAAYENDTLVCDLWSRHGSFAARGWRRATVLRLPCRLRFASPPGTNLNGLKRRCSVRPVPLFPSLHAPA